jgi:hypothetical protein
MNIISQVISQINWVWYAFALVAAFAVGALWYSLVWFKKWKEVFKVDMPDQDTPAGWIRSFLIQFVTGGMLGLLCFVLAALSLKFAIFAVLTIAGWQACTNTFKFGSWRRFLLSVAIESGYTVAASAVYILFSYF